jgi:hypothetical protein
LEVVSDLLGVLINHRATLESDIANYLQVICKCIEFNGKSIFLGILNLDPEIQQLIVCFLECFNSTIRDSSGF